MSIERQLIAQISNIAWDSDNLSLVQKIARIQGYLYEYEAIMDHASLEEEQLYSEYAESFSK